MELSLQQLKLAIETLQLIPFIDPSLIPIMGYFAQIVPEINDWYLEIIANTDDIDVAIQSLWEAIALIAQDAVQVSDYFITTYK